MNISPSSNAKKQILAASKYIQLSPETLEQIFAPDRILSSTLVLKKDNGEIESFPCYRSQHNNAR